MKDQARLPVLEVHVATLPQSGYPLALRPDERQRAALAQAAGVTSVHGFEADIVLRRWRRDGVELVGDIRAQIEQPCIVSLEPVRQDIAEKLRLTFLPQHSALAKPVVQSDRELVLDPEGEDPPETFSGDSIDIWPVMLEMLILAIDTFPRAEGAQFDAHSQSAGDDIDAVAPSPFSVLKNLKSTGK